MMIARRALIELALVAYPHDFRDAYRLQILSDVEEGDTHALGAALNLLLGGLSMRADLCMRDVIYALRRLRDMPIFVCVVAATFALGIGVNVAVFSILNTVLLKPLPYANVDRLVVFREHNAHQPGTGASLSVPEVGDFTAQSTALQFVSASSPDGATLTGQGKPKALLGYDVTPLYFSALGVRPRLGRFFTEADERKGVANAIISDTLWRGSFGADPNVVGHALRLDRVPYTIVGVAPPGFRVPDAQRGTLVPADYFLVQPDRAPPRTRGAVYLGGLAVLRPGVSIQTADAELALISKRLQRQYPGYESGTQYFVVPLTQTIFGGVSAALWTLFVAVLGVLVITCANVASMLLTGASTRDREFAVRSALGASRRRLLEQLLIETGALAVLGGILGIGLAYGILALLRPALSILPHIEQLGIDASALWYAVGLVALSTLLAGLWPIVALPYGNLHTTLKTAGRSGTNASGNRLRAALVVSEVAVALALVILSGLMARSYFALIESDLGVHARGVVATGVIGLPSRQYSALARRASFERRLLDRLRALPGVDSAALAVSYPLSDMLLQFQIGVIGKTFPVGQEPSVRSDTITPGYFQTLGLPVLRGRAFNDVDTNASAPVAIVNETFARMFGKNGNAVGMRVTTPGWNGTAHATRTIVGVVADERANLEDRARPEFYVPIEQGPPNFVSAIVRSRSIPPSVLETEVRNAVAATDPSIAPPVTHTFDDLIAQSSQEQRSIATLIGSLAVVALLLALFGIFGVVSYSVTQRYGEFGVRVALGARAIGVLADVVVRALKVTVVGAAIGVALAAFCAQAVGSQLYRVSPLDPLTFTSVVALIVVCAGLAALLPAFRAVRIDPATALRYE